MSQKFHITCTLPNASLNINGIDFVQIEKNVIMTAETVGAEIADHFREIPGYAVEALDDAEAQVIAEAERLAAEARARVLQKARAKAKPAPAPTPAAPPVIEAASAAAAAGGDTKTIQDAADAAVDEAAKEPPVEGAEGDKEPAPEGEEAKDPAEAAKAGADGKEELF